MTLPCERTRAVLTAGDFLRRLSSVYQPDGIKGIRREVRQEARRILRHFPLWCDIGRADCWDEAEALRYGNGDEVALAAKPEWMGKPYLVDPPSGWKYGFPRLYDPANDGPMRAWLVKNGYPKALADKDLSCTFTAQSEGVTNE